MLASSQTQNAASDVLHHSPALFAEYIVAFEYIIVRGYWNVYSWPLNDLLYLTIKRFFNNTCIPLALGLMT